MVALLIMLLQGNCYVHVGGHYRFLELLHLGQEDLHGTCCQHHQRRIEVRCAWKDMCMHRRGEGRMLAIECIV
jgi:hypothetical protein